MMAGTCVTERWWWLGEEKHVIEGGVRFEKGGCAGAWEVEETAVGSRWPTAKVVRHVVATNVALKIVYRRHVTRIDFSCNIVALKIVGKNCSVKNWFVKNTGTSKGAWCYKFSATTLYAMQVKRFIFCYATFAKLEISSFLSFFLSFWASLSPKTTCYEKLDFHITVISTLLPK